MPAKPNARNWNDIQTVIAASAIVATLGMWNLFTTPAKTVTAQTKEPTLPPTEPPVTAEPTSMPKVKIMFTQLAPQTTTLVQSSQPQQVIKKKKKNKDNNGGGGGGGGGSASVAQTKSS